jgi:hypothetical protein
VIVYFWQFFENDKSSPHFRTIFSTDYFHALILAKKHIGRHCGRRFSQTHLVTLVPPLMDLVEPGAITPELFVPLWQRCLAINIL